jgi:hypothetical protein
MMHINIASAKLKMQTELARAQIKFAKTRTQVLIVSRAPLRESLTRLIIMKIKHASVQIKMQTKSAKTGTHVLIVSRAPLTASLRRPTMMPTKLESAEIITIPNE